jgi:thiamine biosynthesis lipoprotein
MDTREFFLFDTVNTVAAPVLSDETMAAVESACLRYEKLFSRFDEGGELYRVNHARGREVEVDPELACFIARALDYCAASDGLFDITMGAVTRLWDFKHGTVPAEDDVRAALSHVDWRGVHVGEASVRLDDPEAVLELGGIAKGYIADGVLDVLANRGVDHAIVNLGGNVAVRGGRPDGTPWQVGLRQPLASHDMSILQSFAVVGVTNGSVVTSGVYERAFERDGRSYHHILDPRTGFPARTDVVSATVISPTSLDGDGYSTTLVLMGVDRALEFALARPDLDIVLVDDHGQVLATPGVGERIPFRLVDGQ